MIRKAVSNYSGHQLTRCKYNINMDLLKDAMSNLLANNWLIIHPADTEQNSHIFRVVLVTHWWIWHPHSCFGLFHFLRVNDLAFTLLNAPRYSLLYFCLSDVWCWAIIPQLFYQKAAENSCLLLAVSLMRAVELTPNSKVSQKIKSTSSDILKDGVFSSAEWSWSVVDRKILISATLNLLNLNHWSKLPFR